EAPGVVAPGHVVVAQAPEIIRALRRHPAHDGRIQATHEVVAHVDEAGAPRRQQPLLRATGEDVDVKLMKVEGHGPDALDRVHHKEDSALATRISDSIEIHTSAVP